MMSGIRELLAGFDEVARHPRAELDRHVAAGKLAVGIGPYYVPEEIVYAAGAIPFGVWGRMGTASAARKYFPPFYCSICQMTLEMGLNHELDGLSGMVVTSLCDTLRGFSQNYRVGVQQVPMIFLSQPQNRRCASGYEYALSSYEQFKKEVGEVCCAIVDDEGLSQAIRLYNGWREGMRAFLELAGSHPSLVSVAERSAVTNAGYFMDKAEHLAKLKELNALLAAEPTSTDGFKRVVLSGIYYDVPAVMEMLDELGYAVVADDISKESRALQLVVDEQGDPTEALARAFCAANDDSILYDPNKGHVRHVVELAEGSDAQGVILMLSKFCDPEEFDAPFVMRACRDAGIPIVKIEVDQSTQSYEQARTQLETFSELLG